MDEVCSRMPLLGDRVAGFEAQTTKGPVKFPEDYAGKWVVLFSHPADFTPVCTTEFFAFQKRYPEFRALGCELIGLSIDQIFSHIKWMEWIKDNLKVDIEFPVIADDRGKIAESLGMIHPGKGNNTVRAVYIIDPAGIVRLILYYPQEVGRNMDEIIRAVKALQTSDKNKCSMPANWPDNELIKENVIVPPPKDMKAANERKGQYTCYDWWFCHRKI